MLETAINWLNPGDNALMSGNVDLAATHFLRGVIQGDDTGNACRRLIQLMRNREIAPSPLRKIMDSCQQLLVNQPENVLLRTVAAQAALKLGLNDIAIEEITKACRLRLKRQHPEVCSQWSGGPRKPDFLIIGAMKCGTTALYCFLAQHPKIAAAVHKELWFFNDSWQWEGGLEWYFSHFPRLPKETGFRTGEATPFYLNVPETPQRVKLTVPDIRLIVLLRDPIDRIVSDFHFSVGLGHERHDITKALSRDLRRTKSNPNYPGYASRGMYARQLKDWFSHFPREQFLILQQRELKSNTVKTLEKVFRFIDVPNQSIADTSPRNQGSYGSISNRLRSRLAKFYQPHNQELEDLLGCHLNWQ